MIIIMSEGNAEELIRSMSAQRVEAILHSRHGTRRRRRGRRDRCLRYACGYPEGTQKCHGTVSLSRSVEGDDLFDLGETKRFF